MSNDITFYFISAHPPIQPLIRKILQNVHIAFAVCAFQ